MKKVFESIIGIVIFIGAAALTNILAPGLSQWEYRWIALVWIVACALRSQVSDFFSAAFGYGKNK